jgi:DNA helicase II / ATP-dependent DNA helicase PcrA
MLTADTTLWCDQTKVPIRDIREGTVIRSAAGWGECGLSTVRDIYVQFDHKGPIVKLTTSSGAILRCSPDHICCCRLNPLLRQTYLYLHERSSLGFRVGSSSDLMRDLMAMQQLRHDLFHANDELVDRIWIIDTTDQQTRATFIEKYLVFKYGLPNITFAGRHSDGDLSEQMTRDLFDRIDTPSRAHQLLLDAHMFLDHPHIMVRLRRSHPPASQAIQFVLFGSGEKTQNRHAFAHLIRVDGNLAAERLEHHQFKRRLSSQGVWHLEVTRDDLEEAQLFVKTLSHLDNLEIVKKIQLSKKQPFYLLPASHLKVGMSVPILGDRGIEDDTLAEVTLEDYQGGLYDLKLDGLHNYIVGTWVALSFAGQTPPSARRREPDHV